MPDLLKFPLVLIVVTLIAAASLTAIKGLTDPTRLAQEAETREAARKIVLPDASDYESDFATIEDRKFTYVKGLDSNKKLVGYIIEGKAAGYSSILKVMVGVDKKLKIVAIEVLSQKETPGLGDKVVEILSKKTIVGLLRGEKYDEVGIRPWFQVQFDGKTPPVKVKQDGGGIEAITGATISSRAVCDAVDKAVKNLKLALKK